MNNPKQLIIIGGGSSIKEGIEKGLWDKLKDKFVIGINFSYKYHSNPTLQCYLDKQVRDEHEQEFNALGLIVTKKQSIKNRENEIQIESCSQYERNLTQGVYKGSLTGIYALSLAIHLLDEGEIFLLGYDYGAPAGKDAGNRDITHFYQGELEHRGVGKVNYYNSKGRADQDFNVYKQEKQVKIYNVSLTSKISTFDKISYDEFFAKLDSETYNQPELRQYLIANKLFPVFKKLVQ
jgi:hypothetical protein